MVAIRFCASEATSPENRWHFSVGPTPGPLPADSSKHEGARMRRIGGPSRRLGLLLNVSGVSPPGANADASHIKISYSATLFLLFFVCGAVWRCVAALFSH